MRWLYTLLCDLDWHTKYLVEVSPNNAKRYKCLHCNWNDVKGV